MALTVASVNVNGIRAAVRKGMHDWLDDTLPDIVTLQEVRAPDEILMDLLGDSWNIAHSECAAKGRAGVAIATRMPITSAVTGLVEGSITANGTGTYEDSGRWIEATVEAPDGRPLTVISAYVHTGDAADELRMSEKLSFMGAMVDRVGVLRDAGGHVLLTGDLNVAHQDIDIKNWRNNLGRAGFHPDERAHLDRLFVELGWVDLGRHLGGSGPGPYTWWTYRGRAFDNDVGWRIDYQIASPSLAVLAKDASVHRVGSHAERWSDHAPLSVRFDL